jgi:glycosyltransferase involved in cell wall biosynthesis
MTHLDDVHQTVKTLSSARVAVLLCTYNGDLHLAEQLDSIHEQGVPQIDIWVSDDGSSDKTLEILKKYESSWDKGSFIIRKGPQQGFAANFLSLINYKNIKADYYAFSDQDDIWEIDKLTRALKEINAQSETPELYCSRTELVTESGQKLGQFSPLFKKKPHFRNALMQSLAGGNTMVFNTATVDLIRKVGSVSIISHDWWVYMLVSGVEGKIYYDIKPTILYRQHENNNFGANTSVRAKLVRVKMLFSGAFRDWNKINTAALKRARQYLTEENQKTLDLFILLREANFIQRLLIARKIKLYRQSLMGTIALMGATLFKKL